MTSCRTTNKNSVCGGDTLSRAEVRDCRPFEVCLPFGGQLRFDGACLTLTPPTPPADGVYGRIVVENGCLTDLLPAELPAYTPPPCVVEPEPCAGGAGADISQNVRSLLRYNPQQQLEALLYAEGQGAALVTGAGTVGDPLRVRVTLPDLAVHFNTTTPGILSLVGDGSSGSPFLLAHRASTFTAGAAAGFTFDSYGHVTGYTAPTVNMGVTGINAEPEALTVSNPYGVVTLGMPVRFPSGSKTFSAGGWEVTLDAYGRVTTLTDKGDAADLRPLSFLAQNLTETSADYAVELPADSRLRLSVRGSLGSATPADFSLRLDNTPLLALPVTAGGSLLGLEALTSGPVIAGLHKLTLARASGLESVVWAMIDVIPCA